VLAAFRAAAERLASQRAEEALPVEERMVRMLQRWCKMWEEDLEARSEEVSGGAGGLLQLLQLKGTWGAMQLLLLALEGVRRCCGDVCVRVHV
jgi:hypothetical protein